MNKSNIIDFIVYKNKQQASHNPPEISEELQLALKKLIDQLRLIGPLPC